MSKFNKKFNEIITKYTDYSDYSNFSNDFQNITLAIVPGSFKPPHKGHWDMIMEYARIADKVLVIISNVSKSANANRILSKSSLMPFSKILSNYNVSNDKIVNLINDVKNNPDQLTYTSINNFINNISKYIAQDSDMLKDLINYKNNLEKSLNKSIRKTAIDTEITPETSKIIFDIFIKSYNMENKIEAIIGEKPSPMSSAVPIINDECKNCKIILGASNKGDDGVRWASFIKSFNTENNNEFIEKSVDVKTNISATYIRNNIENIQKDWFPDNISDSDFQLIQKLLLNKI